MKNWMRFCCGCALVGAVVPQSVLADVKAGVDAWSQGDWAGAVAQWQGPASEGDPDAQFNLAQAYRLGRGVAEDQKQAEQYYLLAAKSGHLEAADTYGLLVFQNGRQQEALPYVVDAAERGDARSQYLIGIAHFNGDIVKRDWVRAYALMTLANGAGLPQAVPALAQMDQYIPLEQRQEAAGVATKMSALADARRAEQRVATDLALGQAARAGAVSDARAADTALRQASAADGTQSPAQAGADFARPVVVQQSPPQVVAVQQVSPTKPKASPPAQARTEGPWKVQLGAFGVAGNAEKLWAKLSSRAEIAGRKRLLVPAGRVTVLQAGGYPSKAAAQKACNALKRSGQDCLVKR